VAPNLFASTEPGDLFVIRNPGNIIAPCGEDGRSMADESEGAAIEFSVLALNVSDIIVCGHSECGAMRILADGKPPEFPAPHLQAWLRHAEGAAQVKAGARLKADLAPHNRVSQVNVLQQLENLKTYPMVRDRLAAGRLRLHAWWFDIAQAEVLAYEAQSGEFIIIDDDEAERIMARLDGK
jgi:carbonic anhydrase